MHGVCTQDQGQDWLSGVDKGVYYMANKKILICLRFVVTDILPANDNEQNLILACPLYFLLSSHFLVLA